MADPLFDGHGGGKPGDQVHIGPLQDLHVLAHEGRQAFQIPPLPLGKTMSKARVDFPEPLTPVTEPPASLSLGMERLRFFRLCSRAPCTVTAPSPWGHRFRDGRKILVCFPAIFVFRLFLDRPFQLTSDGMLFQQREAIF